MFRMLICEVHIYKTKLIGNKLAEYQLSNKIWHFFLSKSAYSMAARDTSYFKSLLKPLVFVELPQM